MPPKKSKPATTGRTAKRSRASGAVRPRIRHTGPSLDNLLNEASRRSKAELRRVVSAEGVPVEFWRVLEALADEKGRSMSELAEAIGMQLPATSKVIDRMTDAALIQRSIDPADQRRVILHISDFGLRKVDLLRDEMREHRSRKGRGFGAASEKQLRELLTQFIRAQRQAAE